MIRAPGPTADTPVLDPLHSAGRRGIEVCVKDAAAAAELQLQALAFPNLERGIAEALDEIVRGQAKEVAADVRRRCDDGLLHGRLLLRSGGTAGENEGDGGNEATHGQRMHAAPLLGKVARR